MQFLADIVKSMNVKGYITINDLYSLSEKEVIDRILNCEDKYIRENFKKFQNATSVYESDVKIEDKYCISVIPKRRYIIPLTIFDGKAKRINEVSKQARDDINKYLNIKDCKYSGFDFKFEPYISL